MKFKIRETIHDIVKERADLDKAVIKIKHISFHTSVLPITTAVAQVTFSIEDDSNKLDASVDINLIDLITGVLNDNREKAVESRIHQFISDNLDEMHAHIEKSHDFYIKTTPGRVLHKLLERLTKPEYRVELDVSTALTLTHNYLYRWTKLPTALACNVVFPEAKLDISTPGSMVRSFLIHALSSDTEKLSRWEGFDRMLVDAGPLRLVVPTPVLTVEPVSVNAFEVFEDSRWIEAHCNALIKCAHDMRQQATYSAAIAAIDEYIGKPNIRSLLEGW